jgi:4-alpha-glucanotransferase
MAEGRIQRRYLDALGRIRSSPPATVAALRRAMGGDDTTAEVPEVFVVEAGARTALGPAEIQLEDGTTRTIDRRLPADLPEGYHRIRRRGRRPGTLIVAPPACYLSDDYAAWGWAVQIYAARSRRSWGLGDLADLRWLNRWAREQGAGITLINPLSAPAPVLPQQPSPYFPSSRRFVNPLYLRIEEIAGARQLPGLPALARRARALNRERLIDRDAVFAVKMDALEQLWRVVRKRRDPAFDAFVNERGESLAQFATFSALAERFRCGWQGWPEAYRHPAGPQLAREAAEPAMRDRIRFHQWLQFQLDRQLARASQALPVMQDLPIGFDAGGADAWAFQDVLAHGVSVGAPPDEFNTRGQDWGLPPFVPTRLRAAGYAPFVDTIRACLRHAGGLRIDHVMGLFRLFWIPAGMEPKDGAYVTGFGRDLLGIVALESQRARAVIVGEDLGTVDEAVRAALAARRVLSYRLFYFEKTSPADYPREALAAITTHDLPTLAGLWDGSDLEAQHAMQLAPNEAGTREIADLVRRTSRAGTRTAVETVISRVYDALASAPCRLVTATLDDAMCVAERPNMPATTHQWPNWSIALPAPIETLRESALAKRIGRSLGRRQRRSAS